MSLLGKKNILNNQKLLSVLIAGVYILLSSCSSGGGNSTTSVPQLCGTTVYPSNTGFSVPSPILESSQVWSFVSEPNLHPMKVSLNPFDPSKLASGLIFSGPYATSNYATYGQSGALIADNDGNPVWFRPLSSTSLMNSDFRVQSLYGSPVLTFWQGTEATPPAYTNLPSGAAEPGACYYIVDNNYQLVKTVSAYYDFVPDVHEFLITPDNTALFFATKVVPMNLTPYGGPESGAIHDFSIQEVDLTTNKLVFFWDAKDHIPLESTHIAASTASETSNVWDPYHLNSIGLVSGSKDDIVFSSRNTWTIYRLNKPTGKFVWQLAGDGSGDFKIPESSAQFSWQHDARYISESTISMFDDNCCTSYTDVPPGTTPSHGLILNLDFNNMVVTIESSYSHSESLFSSSQGNTQWLDNGNKFVGWGGNGYYTEFAESGNIETNPATSMLYDAKMPGSNISYRAYRINWVGTPYYPPKAVAKIVNNQVTVYASWNGSTETKFWQVYAGSSSSNLSFITSIAKTGFETVIPVAVSSSSYVQVKAIDAEGRVIGASSIILPSQ